MAIARLDTAASGNTDGASYTVSSGTDRCLVIGFQQEGNLTPDQVTITWGGQSMTQVHGLFLDAGGNDNEVRLFILLEAGIAAASGSTISITGEGTNFDWSAISYTGVNQTGGATTVPETNDDSTASETPNPLTGADIVSVADNAVVALAGMGNAGTAAWGGTNPLTEQTEVTDSDPTTTTGSLADRLVTASETVAVECTWTTPNRHIVCSIELAAATVGETASGSPSITKPTSSGNTDVVKIGSGTPAITAVTASGQAEVINEATGNASITKPTSTGAGEIKKTASGTPSITKPTSVGVLAVTNKASGSPSITKPTSSGSGTLKPFPGDTDVRVTFPTPTRRPVTGAGRQMFRVNVRRDSFWTGTGVPTVDIYLYEDGVVRGAALISGVSVTSDTGQIIQAPWDASSLVTDLNGSVVECFVDCTSGGTGANRRAVEIGAIEWTSIETPIADQTASGTPSITPITAAGVSEVVKTASGSPSTTPITASGAATAVKTASGTPSITKPVSAGIAERIETGVAVATIAKPTSAGSARNESSASGAPSIGKPTSAGVARSELTASGSPILQPIASAGTAEVKVVASGSPSITKPTSVGAVGFTRPASGAPSITPVQSAGVASLGVGASGSPSITKPTSAGLAIINPTTDEFVCRILQVPAEDRKLEIAVEDRKLEVAAEDRKLEVAAEDRLVGVPSEDRKLEIPAEDRTHEIPCE